MKKYIARATRYTVLPPDEPIFSEMATEVSIDDEAGGEFVRVEQHGNDLGKIHINPDEWPALRAVINRMMRKCQSIPENKAAT